MKKLYVLFFVLLFLPGCYSYREYPVEYDYSYHGKFKKYKSFAFLENSSSINNTTVSHIVIENIIKSRLQTQGYNYKLEKAHFSFNYTIASKNVVFGKAMPRVFMVIFTLIMNAN